MAYRTTRDKIRFQLEKAELTLDRPIEHLKGACDRAEGRQPVLTENVPVIVAAIVEIQGAVRKLRESC
jgi:hypothetical protein